MLYNRDDFKGFSTDVPKDLVEILSTKPFSSDVALSDWLKDASKILEILKTKEIFDNIQIPEAQTKWALCAFIESCPFVDKKTKENYISQIENTHNNSFIKKNNFFGQKRDEFKKYMAQQGLKKTTIALYVFAINKISEKYDDNLWAVTDVALIDNILQKLCSGDVPSYFRAALNQYYSFLENQSGKYNHQSCVIAKSYSVRTNRQRGSMTNYENNLIGFCFSCGHEPLFPGLSQVKAIEEAAKTLEIPFNTLKNIMSYFDYYITDSGRNGWAVTSEKMKDNHKEILDKYATNINGTYRKDDKKLAIAYAEAKSILGLN